VEEGDDELIQVSLLEARTFKRSVAPPDLFSESTAINIMVVPAAISTGKISCDELEV